MSNKQGQIASHEIGYSQENNGRYIREDKRVVNIADAYDFSGCIKAIIADKAGRQALVDVFGKIVTARQVSQISENFSYGGPSTGVVSGTTGSGELTIEESLFKLKTTTEDGTAFAESLESLRYLPGFGGYGWFTVVGLPFGKPQDARIGLFTTEDGFFIGVEQGIPLVGKRRYTAGNPVTELIYQDDWNLDKLDGTGYSQMIADFNYGQVFHITYGYLGFACIFFSIMNEQGQLIPFHVIEYPNKNLLTNVSLPYLPIRVEIDNTGSGEAMEVGLGSLDLGIYDGGGQILPTNRLQGVSGDKALATPKSVTAVDYVIAIRSKEIFSGRTNRINSVISAISWSTVDSVKGVSLEVIKDPDVVTPGTWTDLATIASPLEWTIDTVYDLTTGQDTGIGYELSKDDKLAITNIDKEFDVKLRRGETFVVRVNSTNGIVSGLYMAFKDLF